MYPISWNLKTARLFSFFPMSLLFGRFHLIWLFWYFDHMDCCWNMSVCRLHVHVSEKIDINLVWFVLPYYFFLYLIEWWGHIIALWSVLFIVCTDCLSSKDSHHPKCLAWKLHRFHDIFILQIWWYTLDTHYYLLTHLALCFIPKYRLKKLVPIKILRN